VKYITMEDDVANKSTFQASIGAPSFADGIDYAQLTRVEMYVNSKLRY